MPPIPLNFILRKHLNKLPWLASVCQVAGTISLPASPLPGASFFLLVQNCTVGVTITKNQPCGWMLRSLPIFCSDDAYNEELLTHVSSLMAKETPFHPRHPS
ncbi:hypothetical protein LEMLEM_LOCUS1540 [Lemmus lemmus]